MNEENNEVLNLFDDTEEVLDIETVEPSTENTPQDNILNTEEILEIDPVNEPIENTNQTISNTEKITDFNNKPIIDEKTTLKTEKNNLKQQKQKKYVSYAERITKHIVFIVLCIIILIISIIGYNKYKEIIVEYKENSTIDYQVCLKKNDYYKETCQKEGVEYISSLTDKIRADFTYTEVYQEKVKRTYDYYINSVIITQTDTEESKELLKEEKPLTKTKKYQEEANVININDSIEISFDKYNDYVQKYINDYSLIGNSKIVLSLVVKKGSEEKEVSTLTIPLTELTYNIKETELKEQTATYKTISHSPIKKVFIGAIIISSILLFIAILNIMRFIYKSTNKQTKYQKEVKRILNTYDRVIITLEDKNTIVNETDVYTVKTFLELLDVRDTIDKPILYYKVNDIKTEFYVQDINKTYKYTMKEVDYEEKK